MPSPKIIRMRHTIEKAMQGVDECIGSKMVCLYPHWSQLRGTEAKAGLKFQHGGDLYAVNEPGGHIFSDAWIPGKDTESLYRLIPEWFEGTTDDPIPYKGNIVLELGKYYVENGILYECIRDSGIPVHEPLAILSTEAGGSFVKEEIQNEGK